MTRVPAHDRDSERQLIGSCMLVRAIATDLVGTVDERDFYVPAHALAWGALAACEREGLQADTSEMRRLLAAAGTLERAGGDDFLDGLTSVIPTIANAEAHAKRVRQLAAVRAMGEAAALVHAESYDVDDPPGYLARAERVIAEAAQRLAPEREPVTLGQAAEKSIERLVARQSGELDDGAPLSTGLRTLDWMLGGGNWPGRLIIIAGRPGMGKSALGQVEATAAGKRGPVLIFSLEMPDEEVGDRALSADAQIDGECIRASKLSAADMDRLFASSRRLHDANVWVDDSSGSTVAHIRRVARRHKRKRGLALVVIDYLQLMRSERRSDNREQEVAEISRSLKALAKELGVPVIALSQLNRKCEERGDKRPQMNDLRECVSGDTILFDAISGAPKTVRSLAAGEPCETYGIDDRGKVASARVAMAWSTGVREVFALRTRTGRVVKATANHPFLTFDGWQGLDALKSGERIAVPRVVPEPTSPVDSFSDEELRLVGYLISDGHYGKHHTCSYVKGDGALCADVRQIVASRFGIEAKHRRVVGDGGEQMDLTAPATGPGGNPLLNWLRDIGIHGQVGAAKRLPTSIWTHSNRALGIVLGALWAGDGTVTKRKAGGWALKFSNTSMGLLREMMWVLTRLGVVATLGKACRNTKSTRDIATISISESDAIIRFAEVVAVPGVKGERLALAVARARSCGRNSRVDRLPIQATTLVASMQQAAGLTFARRVYRPQGKEMCRSDMMRVAQQLSSVELGRFAASDVLWDEVDSITPCGYEETFDIRVPGLHTFVGDNIFSHNSGAIEQDADVVMFVYRDEVYNPESKEKGIAEVIVAKQRGGRTGTVKLCFRKELTAFYDLEEHGSGYA